MRKNKGVAGLNILLAVIVAVFIIGLIVFIYATLGSKTEETAWKSTTVSFKNTTLDRAINSTNSANITGIHSRTLRNCILTVTQVINQTGDSAVFLVDSANYTINADCSLSLGPGRNVNNSKWNVTGSYVYLSDTSTSKLINSSTTSLSPVTNHNSTIIIITILVILILLTAIILSAIRGTGEVDFGGKESTETA